MHQIYKWHRTGYKDQKNNRLELQGLLSIYKIGKIEQVKHNKDNQIPKQKYKVKEIWGKWFLYQLYVKRILV